MWRTNYKGSIMKITPLKTNDISVVGASKTLVYGMHGSGKTTQCANYAKRFGKGLILSGESGLSSIADIACDYLLRSASQMSKPSLALTRRTVLRSGAFTSAKLPLL